MKSEIECMKKALLKPRKNVSSEMDKGLSTGCTMLNLGCTGNPNVGFLPGHYYFLVGDTTSGKTWLSLTCCAEATINSNYDDYRLIYDQPEFGALMDKERFFGPLMAKRLEPPEKNKKGKAIFSSNIEEFFFHLDDAFNQERPFVYILDSMDALTTGQEREKFIEQKDAYRKGKDLPGSYGLSKAKWNSSSFPKVIDSLKQTGSILIVISQTRDNIGFGFEKKTRAGGRALTFYATLELWSSVVGRIKRLVRGVQRQLGVFCKVQIKKNRVIGRERSVIIPIYHSIGIDDLGSCVEFLVNERHWLEKKGIIKAPELGLEGKREQLIRKIEEKGLEPKLKELTNEVWQEIEEECKVSRKPRYG
mgnify:CR=1 FL=1